MPSVEWVYANGCTWVTLDPIAQQHIESLWSMNSSSWIESQFFQCPVFIDIDKMLLMCNGLSYSIARRRA
ncbi:hypothetical protein A0J61_03603 [Choanephora cucurbitarum]|uniref:WWE domain-containing protein n=1 Tax=Choanephora cucurbitarum TaxID=101091 RepID=A0A1C7NII5_9FUNG|nr:hypothetical protein A0J61_03603 [Choanephora cucurbitarum]